MPKVSISLITYNHENFIAQAIDSVLMQKTNFDFEILIGEDDSTDNTRNIVKDYYEKYPDKIRLILHDRRNSLYHNGRKTGRLNYVNNLLQCGGEFIAYLDGDDYWTCKDKLQTQVDYLESHPESALVFHKTEMIDDSTKKLIYTFKPPCIKDEYSLSEYLNETNFIHHSSILFRNWAVEGIPKLYFKIISADLLTIVYSGLHGNFGYIDKLMSVYRAHPGGMQFGNPLPKRYANTISTYKSLLEILPDEYIHDIKNVVDKYCRIVLNNCYSSLANKKFGDARNYLLLISKYDLRLLLEIFKWRKKDQIKVLIAFSLGDRAALLWKLRKKSAIGLFSLIA